MQLADGRKNLQEIRNATAQRVADLRASRGSSLHGECNEEEAPDEILEQAGHEEHVEAPTGLKIALYPGGSRLSLAKNSSGCWRCRPWTGCSTPQSPP